jgi:hypothetical protein
MAWNGNPKIVFLGTGAIGASAGAWVAAHHADTFLLSRGKTMILFRPNFQKFVIISIMKQTFASTLETRRPKPYIPIPISI